MAEGNRLGSLQMGIARHDGISMIFGQIQQGEDQILDQWLAVIGNLFNIEAHVGGYLIVAAAAGMEFFADIANPFGQNGFDIHMDIFHRYRKFDVAGFNVEKNRFQRFDNLFRFFESNNILFPKHSGMGNTSCDVLFIQALIKGYGRVKIIS